MNTRYYLYLFLIPVFSLFKPPLSLGAQDVIPAGTAVHVDGIIVAAEWDDARSFRFGAAGTLEATALLKHDGENLLMALICEGMETWDSLYVIPELFLDTKKDGGAKFGEDDYWFHVSAQDCYARGKRDDYSGCRADITSWRASPNLPFQGQGYALVDTFELSIPFGLTGISEGQELGLCMSVLIFAPEERKNIPMEADPDIPGTWGYFRLEPSGKVVDGSKQYSGIREAIENTIGWAAEKDTALLYDIIAADDAYLEVHPEGKVVRGINQFREAEHFWLDPRFRHVGFETRDLQITVSRDGSVAWFYCVLDDLNTWDGQAANWENTRWTGVLENREGKWTMVQMHFSYPE